MDIQPEGDEGWTGATIALASPGGIRTGLGIGDIVWGDLVTSTPFENILQSFELPGFAIRDALEYSVSNENSLILLQISGLKVVYNMSLPSYERIVSLKALCRVCDSPKYEEVEDDKYYRIVAPGFLGQGGDGFRAIGQNARNRIYGPVDIDALTNFVEKNSTFNIPPVMDRITFV